MSPERITGKMQKDIDYNKKSDIWSVGILLYIFICGRPPFYAPTTEELVNKILKGDFLFDGPEWVSNLILIKESKMLIF